MDFQSLDTSFDGHPRTVGLSLEAIGLWTRCFCWVGKHETGGVVSEAAVLERCLGNRPRMRRLVTELTAERRQLWEAVDGGWLFRDYDEHQEVAIAYGRRRKLDRERKRTQRAELVSADIPQTFRRHSADIPRTGAGQSADSVRTVHARAPETEIEIETVIPLADASGEKPLASPVDLKTTKPTRPRTGLSGTREFKAEVERIFAAFVKGTKRSISTKLTPERERHVRARLAQGYDEDFVIRGVLGIMRESWYVQNHKTDLTDSLKNGATLERFEALEREATSWAAPMAERGGEPTRISAADLPAIARAN